MAPPPGQIAPAWQVTGAGVRGCDGHHKNPDSPDLSASRSQAGNVQAPRDGNDFLISCCFGPTTRCDAAQMQRLGDAANDYLACFADVLLHNVHSNAFLSWSDLSASTNGSHKTTSHFAHLMRKMCFGPEADSCARMTPPCHETSGSLYSSGTASSIHTRLIQRKVRRLCLCT